MSLATGSDDLQRTLLPAAATGTSVIAYGTANGLDIAGGVATGRVERVLGGAWADQLVLAHGEDLAVVAANGDTVQRKTLDGLDPSMAWRASTCPVPR
jgi:hypothetical protein